MFKRIIAVLCIWLVVFFNASVANAGGFLSILVYAAPPLPCTGSANACVQDFTTYTKVDASSQISSITSSTITSKSNWETRDYTAYVYKDFGASYWNNHVFVLGDFTITGTQDYSQFAPALLTNTIGDINTATEAVGFYCAHLTSQFYCYAQYNSTASVSSASSGLTSGTKYWYTFDFNPTLGTYGTITLALYSDSGRSSQVGSSVSLALPSGAPSSFEFVEAFAGNNASVTSHQATAISGDMRIYH